MAEEVIDLTNSDNEGAASQQQPIPKLRRININEAAVLASANPPTSNNNQASFQAGPSGVRQLAATPYAQPATSRSTGTTGLSEKALGKRPEARGGQPIVNWLNNSSAGSGIQVSGIRLGHFAAQRLAKDGFVQPSPGEARFVEILVLEDTDDEEEEGAEGSIPPGPSTPRSTPSISHRFRSPSPNAVARSERRLPHYRSPSFDAHDKSQPHASSSPFVPSSTVAGAAEAVAPLPPPLPNLSSTKSGNEAKEGNVQSGGTSTSAAPPARINRARKSTRPNRRRAKQEIIFDPFASPKVKAALELLEPLISPPSPSIPSPSIPSPPITSKLPTIPSEELDAPPIKKKRGRPLGSKNKPFEPGETPHSRRLAQKAAKRQKLMLVRVKVKRSTNHTTGMVLPGDDEEPDSLKAVSYFEFDQGTKPAWLRSLTGPRLPNEFTSSHYTRIVSLPQPHTSVPSDTKLFQLFIDDVNGREIPNRARIRICPPPSTSSGPFAPPFDSYYTNRIIYPNRTIPVVLEGCKCQGRCLQEEYRESCECRKRQEAACKTREGREARPGHEGFAYDEDGRLRWEEKDPTRLAPIIECGSKCACPPGCGNRAAGDGPRVDLDIFWTGNRGWGVRVPPVADGGTLVKKGTPLGVYAGELLKEADVQKREEDYKESGDTLRNYLYDLDYWHGREDLIDLRWRAVTKKPKSRAASSSKTASVAIAPQPVDFLGRDLDDGLEGLHCTVDAHRYGNFTRYCNHCCVPNAMARAVYIDDCLITRPLHVFFAHKDIAPGDEITISYSSEEATLPPGQTLEEYKATAAARRGRADPHERCLCGLDLCRGVMFRSAGEE
ncbi:hypothetical protein P7C70_g805, partial [Phenoliferia sp. Uapishka_3]